MCGNFIHRPVGARFGLDFGMLSTAQTAIRVALPVPLPRLFDYLAPDGLVPDRSWVGRRIQVPFGRGEQVGLVVDVGPPAADAPELKRALGLLDAAPLLGGELLETLRFCARYYQTPLGEVLATALPVALRDGQPLPETAPYAWTLTAEGTAAAGSLRGHGKPRRLVERLLAGPVSEDALELDFEDWRVAARALNKRGPIQAAKAMSATLRMPSRVIACCNETRGAPARAPGASCRSPPLLPGGASTSPRPGRPPAPAE